MNLTSKLRNAHRRNDVEAVVKLCADTSIDDIEPYLRHRVLFWALEYRLSQRVEDGSLCVSAGGHSCPVNDNPQLNQCGHLDPIAGEIITAVKSIKNLDSELEENSLSRLSNIYVLAWKMYTCKWFTVLYDNWPGLHGPIGSRIHMKVGV